MNQASQRIGVEFISVLGLPPVAYVELVVQLGCRHLGIALEPIARFEQYPMWSLRDDARLRHDLLDAMRRSGVTVTLGEGFLAWPDRDIRETAADLDLMCELGALQVNLVSLESDRQRAFDQCAVFAELAGARGLNATLEFIPGMLIADLATAIEVVRHVGRSNFRLLVDAMHFFRSGSDLSQLAQLDPAYIGHVQLCDVPWVSRCASYGEEAKFERLPPGEGELPLRDFLQAVPKDITVGLEIPMLSRAQAGASPLQRLAPCVAAARTLLDVLE